MRLRPLLKASKGFEPPPGGSKLMEKFIRSWREFRLATERIKEIGDAPLGSPEREERDELMRACDLFESVAHDIFISKMRG